MTPEQSKALLAALETAVAILKQPAAPVVVPPVVTVPPVVVPPPVVPSVTTVTVKQTVVDITTTEIVVRFDLSEPSPLAVRYGPSPEAMKNETMAERKSLAIHIQRPKIVGPVTYYQAFDPIKNVKLTDPFSHPVAVDSKSQIPLGKYRVGVDSYGQKI